MKIILSLVSAFVLINVSFASGVTAKYTSITAEQIASLLDFRGGNFEVETKEPLYFTFLFTETHDENVKKKYITASKKSKIHTFSYIHSKKENDKKIIYYKYESRGNFNAGHKFFNIKKADSGHFHCILHLENIEPEKANLLYSEKEGDYQVTLSVIFTRTKRDG
jgi:hypothetical protein